MIWSRSHRFDPAGAALADRHYSRRSVGSPQFVPPGRNVVLVAPGAVWVSLQSEHLDHQWVPCWGNPLFRREEGPPASELIRQALAVTRHFWGLPDGPWGMITFVDAAKVRHKRDPGRCYRRAGFEVVGETAGGHGRNPLLVLSCPAERWPDPEPPRNATLSLFGVPT